MRYYIIAGEASGDLHGSNLMKGLAAKDPEAEFRFWGGDLMQAAALCANDLESVVRTAHPEIAEIRQTLESCGASGAAMTGSGSTVYGIFPDEAAARGAYAALRTRYAQTHLVHPV